MANQSKQNFASAASGRFLKGTVVSAKMQKTIVVAVERLKKHPKYQKHFRITKKYQVHDEANRHQIGDQVVFKEGRPRSRFKRWEVAETRGLKTENKK